MIIAALIMVKNEEKSIKVTLDSLKSYINTIIIYDTGSTDNTLSVIAKCCQDNNQILHIKTTNVFNNFAESRNEAIQFAETINVKYLLLFDAGDELKSDISGADFLKFISSLPEDFYFGVLKLKWLVNNVITEHDGVRFIKNKSNIRYDSRYPVHEQFINKNNNILNINQFNLYQNRDLFGESTYNRYKRDIKLLLNAEKCRHNYYYLAETYGALGDSDNYYRYNLYALKINDKYTEDNYLYFRIILNLLSVAIERNMDESVIIKYFTIAIDKNCPLLEIYLIILQYCVNQKVTNIIDPYLEKIINFDKNKAINFNNEHYDYLRWKLISSYCLISKTNLELGKNACLKAIKSKNNEEDIAELKTYEKLLSQTNSTAFRIDNCIDVGSLEFVKKGRIICVDYMPGFKNIPTHKECYKKSIGASEHQLFNMLKNVSNYKPTFYFKLNIDNDRKIDNVYYYSLDSFINFELYDDDIIVLQRCIQHDPKFLDKIKGYKIILWMHDLACVPIFTGSGEWIDYYIKYPAKFKSFISNFVVNNDNFNFVFPSYFSKNNFMDFLRNYDEVIPNKRLHIIHNILYEDEFKDVKEKKTVINLNRIVFASTWFKNISKIIEIFEYIHSKNKDYILVFMEHGYDRQTNYENIMKKKFGKNVEIIGPQNKEEYANIIKNSLCVLISSYPETFGCVFTESYYLGTPVIADHRSGAVADHLDNNYVFDYDKPEEVYKKIEFIRKERHKLHIELEDIFKLDFNIKKWKKLLEIDICEN